MRPDLLVCPGCRRITPERIDLYTLVTDGDFLACTCGRRYPVVDGVPAVVADPDGYLAGTLVETDLAPPAAEVPGPDDAAYARLLEHVSIYMDAHWSEPASPAIAERLAALPRVTRAVELGCSAGRIVGELARSADHVVGIDLQLATLRRARRVLAGEPVTYARRMVGRHYAPVVVQVPAVANVTLAVGDALDPPLVPGMYARVVALNLLDSVRSPRQLLAVVDALCAPGGELILSSPYAWQSEHVADDERFGGADPAAALAHMLRIGADLRARYEIVDEADLSWTLRRDARSQVTYRIHYLRARRGS
ncbi:MAG: methyltransferase domain-containing protein [Acidobacteriota bacterium]